MTETNNTIDDIHKRLDKLEASVSTLIISSRENANTVNTLARIMEGDPRLNVGSLREEVRLLGAKIEVLEQRWSRVTWIAIGLGLTNGGLIITILTQLFTKGLP